MGYDWWPLRLHFLSYGFSYRNVTGQENLLKTNAFVFQVSFANCSYINEHTVSWINSRSKYLLCNWVCKMGTHKMSMFLVLYPQPPALPHDSLLENIGVLHIWLIHVHQRFLCRHHDMWMLHVSPFHPFSCSSRPCALPLSDPSVT